MIRKCAVCGRTIPNLSAFCVSCGTPFTTPVSRRRSKGSLTLPILTGLITGLVLAGVVLVVALMKDNFDDTTYLEAQHQQVLVEQTTEALTVRAQTQAAAATVQSQTATAQAQATATAQARLTATAQAEATATAQAQAVATATAQAQAIATATAQAQAAAATATAQAQAQAAAATATAQAAATVAAQIQATAQAIQSSVNRYNQRLGGVYGPYSGQLTHRTDNLIPAFRPNLTVQNFKAEVTFYNPNVPIDDTKGTGWDYGIAFRGTGTNQEYRLIINNFKQWDLILTNGTEADDSAKGDSTASGEVLNLNILKDGSNRIEIYAFEGILQFYVNGAHIGQLNIGGKITPGDIFISTGFFNGNQYSGASTRYQNFSVWPIR